jgi:hypothetical protein
VALESPLAQARPRGQILPIVQNAQYHHRAACTFDGAKENVMGFIGQGSQPRANDIARATRIWVLCDGLERFEKPQEITLPLCCAPICVGKIAYLL